MVATLAGLPALVIDNLPATAEAQDAQVEAVGTASSDGHDEIPTAPAPGANDHHDDDGGSPDDHHDHRPAAVEVAPPTTEAPAPAPEVALVAESAPAPPTTAAPPATPPPAPISGDPAPTRRGSGSPPARAADAGP